LIKKVTLVELSADPGYFIPFLVSLNTEHEQEHIDHKPYDDRRLPLPKLFHVLPKPAPHPLAIFYVERERFV
jgi:hypothetical protein